jgi:hypothetical protein
VLNIVSSRQAIMGGICSESVVATSGSMHAGASVPPTLTKHPPCYQDPQSLVLQFQSRYVGQRETTFGALVSGCLDSFQYCGTNQPSESPVFSSLSPLASKCHPPCRSNTERPRLAPCLAEPMDGTSFPACRVLYLFRTNERFEAEPALGHGFVPSPQTNDSILLM